MKYSAKLDFFATSPAFVQSRVTALSANPVDRFKRYAGTIIPEDKLLFVKYSGICLEFGNNKRGKVRFMKSATRQGEIRNEVT